MHAIRISVSLAVAVLLGALAGAASAQVPLRKNIDLLRPEELAAYEHAIQILKDRSNVNPYDKTGYLWQAWVHNCPFIWQPASGVGASGSHGGRCDNALVSPPGPDFVASHPGVCEHHKDLFLIWHRAQFYYFEKILQATDPDGTVTDSRGMKGPGTRNVAVPFWNWTRPPTGVRYAKALEDRNSPLFHARRAQNALTPTEITQVGQATSALAVAALVNDPDWQNFGGFPQEASTGGGGNFEYEHHDLMHFFYFGTTSDMAAPPTAALDPAFFSYHSYIDLLLQFWLERHGSNAMTSLDNFLRATQPDSVAPAPGHASGAGLPSMGQGRIYLDPAALGIGYEVTDADRLPAPEAVARVIVGANGAPAAFAATDKSRHARLSGPGLFDPNAGPPTMVAKVAVPVPSTVTAIRAKFQRPDGAPDVSYLIDFYLHPASLDLDLANRSQREKYIVTALAFWGGGGATGHSEHDSNKPLFVNLTNTLKDLAGTGHSGETWTLTAVVSQQPPSAAFGTLSLVP